MIIHGDAIETLQKMEKNSVDTIFTSPNPAFHHPVVDNSIVGGENTTAHYIKHLVVIFEYARDVLKDSGSLFVHMTDLYDVSTGGLMLVPPNFANAMLQVGWILKDDLSWHRTEKLREEDYNHTRFRRDKEIIYRFVKDFGKDTVVPAYFNTKGHNYWRTSVFSYPYKKKLSPGAFESGMPEELVKMAIWTTTPKTGVIMDPMAGTGTVGAVAKQFGIKYVLIDTSEKMVRGMKKRLEGEIITK